MNIVRHSSGAAPLNVDAVSQLRSFEHPIDRVRYE